jgi:hypothetical protein
VDFPLSSLKDVDAQSFLSDNFTPTLTDDSDQLHRRGTRRDVRPVTSSASLDALV